MQTRSDLVDTLLRFCCSRAIPQYQFRHSLFSHPSLRLCERYFPKLLPLPSFLNASLASTCATLLPVHAYRHSWVTRIGVSSDSVIFVIRPHVVCCTERRGAYRFDECSLSCVNHVLAIETTRHFYRNAFPRDVDTFQFEALKWIHW